ncbi:hypothetical protein AXG93_2116s1380 [Marchantia polymorpha subsp. ruderalis]|uniref:Uncharacterized protein n=1 Tax=Marchantia polymorpha subsp. ruderalis TaxID=1480154 RepID=A0A176VM75_MARPO|nr:hypothetical protein AXG93_2116s1380 [Marchantia polymorpha subsp. ruderalis]
MQTMFHALGVVLGDEGFLCDKPANRERVGVQASAGETLIGAVKEGQLMLVISDHLSQALPLLLSEIYASGIVLIEPSEWENLQVVAPCEDVIRVSCQKLLPRQADEDS